MYAYAANNPIKYTDPMGMHINDWQNNGDGTWTVKSEGAALWDVYGAEWKEKSRYEGDPTKLKVGDTVGIPISPSPEKKKFDKISSPNIYYLWNKGFHSDDGKADALYTSAGIDARPDQGQLNFFIDGGIAKYNYTSNEKSFFRGRVKVCISGTLESFTGGAWIGVKDGQIGYSADAGMLKGTMNFNISGWGKTAIIGGELGLGSAASGNSIGWGRSYKSGLGFSYGYSFHVEENK